MGNGDRGSLGSLGPSPARRAGLGFCVVRGSGYARYACAEVDFWEEGHAGGGWGKGMTGEPLAPA